MSARTFVVDIVGRDAPIKVDVLSDDGVTAIVRIDGVELTVASLTVALSATRDGGLQVVADGRRVLLDHTHKDDGSDELLFGAHVVSATVTDERDTWLGGGAAAAGPGLVKVAMPGKVVAVDTAVGAVVKRGDRLLIIEAMKMENPVRAPKDGTVTALHVAVGDAVEAGMVLAEIG